MRAVMVMYDSLNRHMLRAVWLHRDAHAELYPPRAALGAV